MQRKFNVALVLMALTGLFALTGCLGQTSILVRLRHPGLRQLTSEAARYESPRWSPDGKQIAYYVADIPDERLIYIVNSDGTGRRVVPNLNSNGGSPDWSPDGSHLVFTGNADDGREVFRMKPDGKELVQLTHGFLWTNNPRWSPDGSHIAFTGLIEPNTHVQVYLLDLGTNEVTQLTFPPLGLQGSIDYLEWTSDSRRILFLADTIAAMDTIPYPIEEKTGPYLYAVESAGGTPKNLTEGFPGVYYPSRGPQGDEILFSYYGSGDVWKPSGIYVMDPSRNSWKPALSEPTCREPNWSPAQKRLAFVCGFAIGGGQIMTSELDSH